MSDIIKFLRHEGPDFKGRMLRDLWKFDNEQMETSHDVIQWMFPSDIPSQHHVASPVLTDDQVNTMWRDTVIRESMATSSLRFAQFLSETMPEWIHVMDHNYLRITRVIRCMWNMRMGAEYIQWREFAVQIKEHYPEAVSDKTFHYWMNAHNDELFKPKA